MGKGMALDLKTSCRWANLLYIQNFYPGGTSTNSCMDWSWFDSIFVFTSPCYHSNRRYLAVDMQLFVYCTLLVLLLYKNRRWGLYAIGASFAASTVAIIIVSYEKKVHDVVLV